MAWYALRTGRDKVRYPVVRGGDQRINEMYHDTAAKIVRLAERGLLSIIAILTLIATLQEVVIIFEARKVELADLLLLFIYAEVLGMIGLFFVSNRIPITLPLFIAMTAISRLIILQGKDMDMISLLYEAGAILIISVAVLVLRFKPKTVYQYQSDDVTK